MKHILRRYGLTADQHVELRVSQDFRCSICNTHEDQTGRKRLFIDHDHVTGKIRKLLCDPCNRMLADSRETPELLRKAASYLEENK